MQKKLRLILLAVFFLILLVGFMISQFTQLDFWLSTLMGLGLFLLFSLVGFFIWAYHPMGPERAAKECLKNPDGVIIQREKYGLFLTPQEEIDGETQSIGLIFYPGGRVHHLSYLPVLLQLVKRGYRVCLVQMPLYMAVFDYQRAEKIMAGHAHIIHWVIGGHSLGGAMAAHYARRHADSLRGLFLWGAYPSTKDDLSELGLPVQMICTDCDGITTQDKVTSIRSQLPPDARWKVIEGGNHAQFGDYGSERRDLEPSLSPEEQWTAITEEMAVFLNHIYEFVED